MTDFETEMRARYLRDLVFGLPISEHEWNVCKNNWTRPMEIKWLETMADPKPVQVTRNLFS